MENEQVEQVQQVERDAIKWKVKSKSEVIGSFIDMGIVGFCFGIGLMLAVKTVNNLKELIRR